MDADAKAKLEGALAEAVKSEAFVDFVNNKFRGAELFLNGDETRTSIESDAAAYKELLAAIAE